MFKYFILLFLCCSSIAQAKDYQVKLRVKDLPENIQPVLLRIYNGNMFMLDSTAVREQNEVTFNIPENTPPGMLRGVFNRMLMVDFIFNRENIELNIDFNDPNAGIEVIQSDENRIYFDFLKSDGVFFRKLGLLEQIVINYPGEDEFYQKANEFYKKFQYDRDKLIDKIYKTHSKTLAGRIIRNQKLPITTGKLAPEQRDSIFREQFLPLLDFNDTTLLYTNVYTDKLFQYIRMSMKETASPRENEANCIRALDQIVPLLDVNPTIQQHLLQFLIAGFESMPMPMEEVLAHISSNYLQQCGGSADVVKRRLEGYSKMAVGQKVPDFTVNDIQDLPYNLYNDMNPYTLILFWHTNCGHCQILMNQLPALFEKELFSKHQVKLVGISIDDNKEDWKKFSADHDFDWVNTHIEGSFDSPLAAGYNLFATPTMFLIDSDHNIIAKPTTAQELEKNIGELK